MFIKKLTALFITVLMLCLVFSGCGSKKEKVLIYSSAEDYRIEALQKELNKKFPDYNIVIEYLSTGNHAAKLLAEGSEADCDIIHDLEYGYLSQLDSEGILADLSDYDRSIYTDDVNENGNGNYLVEIRSSGAIIINPELLKEKGLKEPKSYEDLLKPEYKGLISMPNPKASSTGYMFLKSLVNAWGEKKAFAYFDSLTENILQYTSSGSGPVNALIQGEVAIGLGMTAQAVIEINNGSNLKVVFFEEGAPYSLYGQAIVSGKEKKTAVKEVFDYLIEEYNYRANEIFFPEKIYKDKDYTLKNYPKNIVYADMSENTVKEKEALLEKWKY